MPLRLKSRITIRKDSMKKKLHPVHPGEVLLEEFLKPMGLSQNRLALNIGVPGRRINEIVLGRRAVTADTALRCQPSSGWGCRLNTTWIWPSRNWEDDWRRRLELTRMTSSASRDPVSGTVPRGMMPICMEKMNDLHFSFTDCTNFTVVNKTK
jgi:addiction module HigA family antidote